MSDVVTTIRRAHRELTRKRIMDAAVEAMAKAMSVDAPISEIAAKAGVTERTVYRHFATREQLADAVWLDVVARMQAQHNPATAAELVRLPVEVFPALDHNEGLIRAAIYSPVARKAARESNPARQAAMLACAEEALTELDAAARRRRAAVLLLISSAYGWAILKDFGGLPEKEAEQAASEAIAVLLGLVPANLPATVCESAEQSEGGVPPGNEEGQRDDGESGNA